MRTAAIAVLLALSSTAAAAESPAPASATAARLPAAADIDAVEAKCDGLLKSHVEQLANDILTEERQHSERDIWFLEDVGGEMGAGALEEVVRRAEVAAKALGVGKDKAGNLERVISASLAALWRIDEARGRAAIAAALEEGHGKDFEPYLRYDELPPPVVYFWPTVYERSWRQRRAVVTPELVSAAERVAVDTGLDYNPAWEYLRAHSQGGAGRVAGPLLLKAQPSDPDYRLGPNFYLFEMLREAVEDGLLDRVTLEVLAKSDSDARRFWGTVGMALAMRPPTVKGERPPFGANEWEKRLEKMAKGRDPYYKALAIAACACCGYKAAWGELGHILVDGDAGERYTLAFALESLYGLAGEGQKTVGEAMESLATDSSWRVVRFALGGLPALPGKDAARIASQAYSGYKVLTLTVDGPRGWSRDADVPSGLFIETEPDDHIVGEISDFPWQGMAAQALVGVGPAALSELRYQMLCGQRSSWPDVTLCTLTLWPFKAPECPDAGTPEFHAWALASLAYLGDEEAATEFAALLDGGVEVPDEVVVLASWPCMIPRLSALVDRLADDAPDSPLLHEACRATLVAVRRARAAAGVVPALAAPGASER